MLKQLISKGPLTIFLTKPNNWTYYRYSDMTSNELKDFYGTVIPGDMVQGVEWSKYTNYWTCTVTIFHKVFSMQESNQCKITARYCGGFIKLSILRVQCNILAVSNPFWLPAKISISRQNKGWKEPNCLHWLLFIKRFQIQIDFCSIFGFDQAWNGICEPFLRELVSIVSESSSIALK